MTVCKWPDMRPRRRRPGRVTRRPPSDDCYAQHTRPSTPTTQLQGPTRCSRSTLLLAMPEAVDEFSHRRGALHDAPSDARSAEETGQVLR